MQLGERLKVEMALWGISAAELCQRTGMGKGYVSRVLNGKKRPRPETVRRIVEAIHADVLTGQQSGAADPGR